MSAWNNYNQKNKRNTQMSRFWVKKATHYLVNTFDLPTLNILDYGCGYFDLGFALANKANKIDGYDPFEPAIEYANQIKNQIKFSGNISSNRDDLKPNNYDLIILNSVIQYFHDKNELFDQLVLFQSLLRQNASSNHGKILLIDILSEKTNLPIDALQNLFVASRNGLLYPMLTHLFKATKNRNDKKLLRLNPEQIERISKQAGFNECTFIDNLSPSKQRFSCIIS